MVRVKHSISVAVAVAVAMMGIGASQAAASGETVSSFAKIKPRGPLSKSKRRPVDVHLEGKVTPGPGQTKLRELLNVKLNLPKDLAFSTNGTPACTKDIGQHDANKANRPTAAIVAECPKSVVGEGTAVINVAGQVSSEVKDPKLVIFNGGKDKKGHAKLLIHGFSATVIPGGFGIMMTGALKKGVLDVHVPPLAANSAVTQFNFDLPGSMGKDKRYVRSSCSSGKWKFNAVMTLADHDINTGGYVNKSKLTTSPTIQKCVGKGGGSGGGKAKLASPRVSGPLKVKLGQRGTYAVKVRNTGKKAIRGVKVKASGKGANASKNAGTLKPGKSKKVKLRIKFRKKGTVRVKFKVSGKGVGAKTKTIKVKVG